MEPGCFIQGEPSVQYRGIFINDERFGGWSRWAEQTFDKESGKVGPKTYQKVFELLLRLKGNLLWPAMHNGTQAFNGDPENARLADEYAIVMGSSHCEQMLRNNEDEWKNVGTYGDFNYITNRQTMIDYWEERVRTNGRYENIYTLGLRGIHDYPMEGARTTEERTALMQKALDDQRDIIRRNVDAPVEEVPQMLCTYEEVLDAYHHGLQVPEDVTLLWSDDKHGYTRNLCNPQEQNRKGGAGTEPQGRGRNILSPLIPRRSGKLDMAQSPLPCHHFVRTHQGLLLWSPQDLGIQCRRHQACGKGTLIRNGARMGC